MMNTDTLRTDVLDVRRKLLSGEISNTVARTLLLGSRIIIDSIRVEIDAARLGCEFKPVEVERTYDPQKQSAVSATMREAA